MLSRCKILSAKESAEKKNKITTTTIVDEEVKNTNKQTNKQQEKQTAKGNNVTMLESILIVLGESIRRPILNNSVSVPVPVIIHFMPGSPISRTK